ncbi:hypothetical protein CC79DRAFT_829178 [Sarocladium strictum]
MFATNHYMENLAEGPKKRGRDDDGSLGPLSPSFGEHRHKRIQCLPLRSSPMQTQGLGVDAYDRPDSATHVPQSHFSPWSSSPATGQFPQDEEMDMMETLNSAPPSRLEAVRIDNASDGGRMPTPIQPSFAAQVRGQQNGWGSSGQTTPPLNGVVNLGHHHSGSTDGASVPRTMGNEADWHAVQQNRRLPSPISEGDDSSNQLKEFADVSIHHHGNEDCGDHEMDHPNAMMDIEPRTSTPPLDANGEPTTPSPKRGHVRNMHTVNNWTWQPGMKKSFSIGFRSDCEKCRLKVPGHFNHIIVS